MADFAGNVGPSGRPEGRLDLDRTDRDGTPPTCQTIVCMKWGNQYGAEYVNTLYGMLARQTKRPFRLVCLTDDEEGLCAEVEWYPIPQIPVPDGPERGWRKLALFAPEYVSVYGERALYLDLDVVLVGSIDAFFEHPGDFVIIKDWCRPFGRIGDASVFRFRPERSTDVYEEYCRNYERHTKRFRNVQGFLSWYMGEFGALSFWPKTWCSSFKRDCIPFWPLNHWRAPHIPRGSRVVVFQGNPKPDDAIRGGPGIHRARAHKPAPWVAEHWRQT